jgi:hypothetical protein
MRVSTAQGTGKERLLPLETGTRAPCWFEPDLRYRAGVWAGVRGPSERVKRGFWKYIFGK